jgi:hypothetical protein
VVRPFVGKWECVVWDLTSDVWTQEYMRRGALYAPYALVRT